MIQRSLQIKESKDFSLGFDPNFQKRYVEFWIGFKADPEKYLRMLRNPQGGFVLFVEMCCKTMSKDLHTRLISVKQFELFECQKVACQAVVDQFQNADSLVFMKSRQMGASWIMAAFACWVAIFYREQVIAFTTKDKETLHRKGDPTTLLGKPEYILERLPNLFKQHAITKIEIMKLDIRVNSSILKGQTGQEAIRSMTATVTINDEFAFNKNASQLMSSISSACDRNFFVSTLNMPNDEFDRMRKSDAYRKVVLSWRDDPRIKDHEKYKRDYIAKNGYANFLREVEMKYNTADSLYLFEPDWVEWFRNNVHYPEKVEGEIVAGLDVAAMGNNMNVLVVRQGPYIMDRITWNQCQAWESIGIIQEYYDYYRWKILAFDEIGVGAAMANEFDRHKDSIKFHVIGVNVSSPAADKLDGVWDDTLEEASETLYVNLRARLYWQLRERMRKTAGGFASPKEKLYIFDEQILDEMGPMTYDTINKGKICIISKRKLDVSPDNLDALMISLYAEEALHTYDVYDELYL